MTRIEIFNKNINFIHNKYNKTIMLWDDRDLISRREKVEWKCAKHNLIFISTIDTLLNNNNTCCCPECRKEKQLEGSLKGVQRRKELKDIK